MNIEQNNDAVINKLRFKMNKPSKIILFLGRKIKLGL